MTGPRINGDIHTLAGAYALDALTEIERAAFGRHVAACESCAFEVAELQETSARLGAALAAPPPARMRTAVLSEVGRTRQVAARPPGRAAARTAVQRWRRWTAGAVAASVLAIGAAATTWVVQQQRLDDERRQSEQLAQRQERVNAVLTAGDVRFSTAPVPGGGKLTVASSPSRNAGVVVLSDLPAPPSDRVYQLWLLSDGGSPASAGVMAAGQRGGTTLVETLGGASDVGVTLEPPGGSAQPSMQPIATVPIA
jgi:anti-sigma-K factor RskA